MSADRVGIVVIAVVFTPMVILLWTIVAVVIRRIIKEGLDW